MKKFLMVLLMILLFGVGKVFGQTALYIHDVLQDNTSGIIMAACLDAGLTFEEQATLPPDLAPYDVIIVYTNNSHGGWGPSLCDFVSDGGSLMTLGATPFWIGMPDCIGAYDYVNSGGQARVVIDRPAFGLHLDDIVDSSNNADPAYHCAAAALTGLMPGAVEIARWEANPNGTDCGETVYSLAYPHGTGIHVFWQGFWQYSAIRGLISFLGR